MAPGQGACLAPPCSNLRSFGSKCSLLYWRKYLRHCWDFPTPPSDSEPGTLCVPPLPSPRYAPVSSNGIKLGRKAATPKCEDDPEVWAISGWAISGSRGTCGQPVFSIASGSIQEKSSNMNVPPTYHSKCLMLRLTWTDPCFYIHRLAIISISRCGPPISRPFQSDPEPN